MNHGPLLFLGIFLTMATSFWGLVVAPNLQIGQQQQKESTSSGEQYPTARPGMAQRGAEVYRANGCMECHTQQVRPKESGSDIDRGWGQRRTVAQDYLSDYPVMLGDLRLGPDLANVGVRRPDPVWHLRHFYNPRNTSPGSLMPSYGYLFERRKLAEGEKLAAEALPPVEGETGVQVVPRTEALELTAYMLSLKADKGLLEAPVPAPPTNQPPAAAGVTNALPPVPTTNPPLPEAVAPPTPPPPAP